MKAGQRPTHDPPTNVGLRSALRLFAERRDPAAKAAVLRAVRDALLLIRFLDHNARTFEATQTADGLALSVFSGAEAFRLTYPAGGQFAALSADSLAREMLELRISKVVIDPDGPVRCELPADEFVSGINW